MDERPTPFPQMDMKEANKECRTFRPELSIPEQCPICKMRVVLHCGECEIQVTGCLCTEEANHGPEIARQRMIDRGVWLPEWGQRPANPNEIHG